MAEGNRADAQERLQARGREPDLQGHQLRHGDLCPSAAGRPGLARLGRIWLSFCRPRYARCSSVRQFLPERCTMEAVNSEQRGSRTFRWATWALGVLLLVVVALVVFQQLGFV